MAARWRTRRAAAVAAWREEVGDICPGYNRKPHASSDLTADHITPRSKGGHEDGPLAILCRSCNSRKRNRTPADYNAPRGSPKGRSPLTDLEV